MKYIFKGVLSVLLMAVCAVVLNSCSSDEGTARYSIVLPSTVELVYDSDWEAMVYYDATRKIDVLPIYVGCTPVDMDFTYTSDYDITIDEWVWSSTDESVAVVDEDGIIYPVGAGSATIAIRHKYCETASAQEATFMLTVAESLVLATEVTVTPADGVTDYVYEGGFILQMAANVTATASDPGSGTDVTYNLFKWYSSNPAIADVDDDGVVTSAILIPEFREDGIDVDIYAQALDGSEVEGMMTITVRKSIIPESVKFSEEDLARDGLDYAYCEKGFIINYEMEPSYATAGLIQWESSNTDAVEVAFVNGSTTEAEVKFVGYSNDPVTISATCVSTGVSQSFDIQVPAGFIRESFQDATKEWSVVYGTNGGSSTITSDFIWGGSCGYSNGSGSHQYNTCNWIQDPTTGGSATQYFDYVDEDEHGVKYVDEEGVKYGKDDSCMQIYTYLYTTTGDNRADIEDYNIVDNAGMNVNFPYFVIHIDYPGYLLWGEQGQTFVTGDCRFTCNTMGSSTSNRPSLFLKTGTSRYSVMYIYSAFTGNMTVDAEPDANTELGVAYMTEWTCILGAETGKAATQRFWYNLYEMRTFRSLEEIEAYAIEKGSNGQYLTNIKFTGGGGNMTSLAGVDMGVPVY